MVGLFLLLLVPLPAFALLGIGDSDPFERLADDLHKNEQVAVTVIYDALSGDVTGLGELWRGRVEARLRDNDIPVVSRRDEQLILEDVETYRMSSTEQQQWEAAGAQVVLTGKYYLHGGKRIELQLNAIRVRDGRIVQSIQMNEPLESGWQAMALKVWHNVFHTEMVNLNDLDKHGPKLTARLDRNPACYPTGEDAVIHVSSEQGVYLYLFSVAADNSVVMLYPNRVHKARRLVGGSFEFPPAPLRQSGDMRLELYPMPGQDYTEEAIKVVASREPLDFSYLPVPENQIFAGALGGSIKKLLDTLKNAREWSEAVVKYGVGPACTQ